MEIVRSIAGKKATSFGWKVEIKNVLMHARRRALSSLSPRDISSEGDYFYQRRRSGIFTRRKVADCLYGGTYISPFWGPLMNARLYDLYIYIHSLLLGRREEGEILHPFARVNTVDPRRLDLDVAQRTIGRGDRMLFAATSASSQKEFSYERRKFQRFFPPFSHFIEEWYFTIWHVAGKFSKRRIDFSVHIESWIRIIRYKRSFSPSLPPVELL